MVPTTRLPATTDVAVEVAVPPLEPRNHSVCPACTGGTAIPVSALPDGIGAQ
jgi:hypothetical protein